MRGTFITTLLLAAMTGMAGEPPARTIPSSQQLASMVPASGPLGMRELTLLALSRRPQLEKLRGLVKVASAQKLAVRDLVNPELRVSYAYDNDGMIRSPYNESETFTTNSSGFYDATTTNTSLNNGVVTDRDVGRIGEQRTRVIERTVTPGVTQDIVEERVYETDSTSTSTFRERTKQGLTSPQTEQQNENRRLLTTNRRVIDHADPRTYDHGLGLLLRFTLPHPWERKARVQRAAAEISLAEADYFAEEDVVVRAVRAAFQELSIQEARLYSQQQRKAAFESYRDWLEKQHSPQVTLDLATARAKVYSTLTDIRALEGQVSSARQQLASYCGVTEASRIVASLPARRISEPGKLDVDYLSSLASLNRSDMLNVQARLAIAKAQLAEAKAASIPFTTFLDLGYSQATTTQRRGENNEFVARIGISIPIWDWTGVNKKREVPKAAAQSLEQQINLQRALITNEIRQAVQRLAAADTQLEQCDKDIAALKADMKKALSDASHASADVNDVIKGKRIEQDFLDLQRQMELSRFTALSAYQDAIMDLEKVVGMRVEQMLSRSVEAR